MGARTSPNRLPRSRPSQRLRRRRHPRRATRGWWLVLNLLGICVKADVEADVLGVKAKAKATVRSQSSPFVVFPSLCLELTRFLTCRSMFDTTCASGDWFLRITAFDLYPLLPLSFPFLGCLFEACRYLGFPPSPFVPPSSPFGQSNITWLPRSSGDLAHRRPLSVKRNQHLSFPRSQQTTLYPHRITGAQETNAPSFRIIIRIEVVLLRVVGVAFLRWSYRENDAWFPEVSSQARASGRSGGRSPKNAGTSSSSSSSSSSSCSDDGASSRTRFLGGCWSSSCCGRRGGYMHDKRSPSGERRGREAYLRVNEFLLLPFTIRVRYR